MDSVTVGAVDVRAELLARRLRGEAGPARASADRADGPRFAPAERGERWAPSPGQRRLWFLDQLQPGILAYNMPDIAHRLSGRLDLVALEQALRAVAERHEILGCRFEAVDGEPFVRRCAEPAALEVVDLRREPDASERGMRLAAEVAQTRFDLAAGPLTRTVLVRLADDDALLLAVFHHTIFDGWSIGLFQRDLATAYAQAVTGQRARLPALPVQYGDFAVWQNAMTGSVAAEHLDYWRDQLSGAPEAVQLPGDRARPAVPSYRGGLVEFAVRPETVGRLRELTAACGASLFMAGLAAFQALVARYTGTTDVIVGCPSAGRSAAGTEELIGFFVNSLPMRADLSDDPSFAELLSRTRDTALGAFAHEDLPFDRLVDELAPARDLSRNPLIQLWFDLFTADSGLELTGLSAQRLSGLPVTTRFDAELHCAENAAGGLDCELIYALDLFDKDTVRRFADGFLRLLDAAVADAMRPVSRLPLLDASQAGRIAAGTGPVRPVSSDTLVSRFAAQVRARPSDPALVHGSSTVTFAELDERAARLSRRLCASGVRVGSVVGLMAARGADLIVGMLGIIKAGAGYLPLDPEQPAERTAYMLRTARAQVVVADAAHADIDADLVVRLDAGTTAAEPTGDLAPPNAGPDDLAYVIYTSGSTGLPKGVAMSHRPLVNLIDWQLERSAIAGPTLQFSSIFFDISMQELFTAWLGGSYVVLVSDEQRRDPDLLLAALAEGGVRRLHCPPPVLEQVARAARRRGSALPVLAEVAPAGEILQLSPDIRALLATADHPALDNQYGPTEAHVITAGRLTGDPWHWPDLPDIGTPVANTRVMLLDQRMEPVPRGAVGEVCVSGVCLARGYVGRSDLTAARFLPDPFAADPGARLYRTGDLARWRSDGSLEFLGRADRQIKIRGYRVEPGEIEAVLVQRPDVAEALVVVTGDGSAARLTAYVVPSAGIGTTADARAVRADLRRLLPEYMVPARIVELAQLPLTTAGKVDRSSLPAPAPERPATAPPAPGTEERVAAIWSEVLGTGAIGSADDFFELGGHSLLAVQAVARVRREFGVELPLRGLFESRTVSEFSALVDTCAAQAGQRPLIPAARGERWAPSAGQRRLWFLDLLQPGARAYIVPLAYRLRGALDAEALRRAVETVVARHEVLRCCFEAIGGEPFIRRSDAPLGLATIDLRDAADPAERGMRLAAELAGTPFDLSSGPLLRTALLLLADDDALLVAVFHHAVFDGWSLGVFQRELAQAYAALTSGAQPGLAALPVQYGDFALWQNASRDGLALDGALQYWRRRLADAPEAVELPSDRSRPVVPSFRGSVVPFEIKPAVTARLRELASSRNATLYMVGLAAFQVLVARCAGVTDLIVGSPSAARSMPEIENLIGFFVNTLPMRAELADDPAFLDLLERTRDSALEAFAHEDLPFEQLVEEVAPSRDLSRSPLIQVFFQLFEADDHLVGLKLPGIAAAEVPCFAVSTRFDLELHCVADVSGGLACELVYADDLFDAVTMELFAARFARLLGAAVDDPSRPVSLLPILDPAESERVMAMGAGPVVRRSEATLLTRFARQVRIRPAAVAVVAGAKSVSYAELDAQADLLARRLRRREVGVEHVVGLCLPRGLALITGMLAILKAGAGYLPLDPEQPVSRARLMLADAGARVLITDASHADGWAGDISVLDISVLDISVLDSAAPDVAGLAEAGDEAARVPGPDGLAYVVYTSGSTGRPKGVAVSHRSMINLVDWHLDAYRLGPEDAVSQLASPSFDAAGWEIWPALLAGSRVCVPPEGAPASVEALLADMKSSGTTVAFAPTPTAHLLARHDLRSTSLRALLTGGDRLDSLPPDGPGVPLYNHYGPTEYTVVTTVYGPVTPGERRPPIGHPLPNTTVRLLDRQSQPVGIGMPGELCVGGLGLARGYVGRPDLTAERFVPDPLAAEPGTRLYRTGDLARWRPDGNLEFLGRADRQVKMRGYRVEPGEVEHALAEHSRLAESVVRLSTAASGHPVLVAYVVGRGLLAPAAADLRAHLAERLPEYMIPAVFLPLAQLPRLPSGKIDEARLPEPPSAEQAYLAPRDEVEEAVAEIWERFLRVATPSVDADFFALGGHSMLAAQVVAEISRAFGVDLPMRALFEHRTIQDMATFLERTVEARTQGGA